MLKRQEKIPSKSISLDCVNYAEKLRLTSDRSFTFIEGRQDKRFNASPLVLKIIRSVS